MYATEQYKQKRSIHNYTFNSNIFTSEVLTDERHQSTFTRNPAIAEGPRDAGVPVEIW